MSDQPGPSNAFSPSKQRERLGHLTHHEKHTVLNMYKMLRVQIPRMGTTEMVINMSKTLRLAKSTVYRIMREYKVTGKLKPPKERVGRHSKLRNFDESVKYTVRQKVHSFFFKNELPTLDKIMAEITMDESIPKMSRATLHRFLKLINFKYVKRNKKNLLIEKDEIIRWRRKYLKTIRQYRNDGRPIFYLDETWLNEGHTKEKVWIDTSITSARQAFVEGLSTGLKSPSGKGRRLIILHIGSDLGFVENGLLLFEGRETADYHNEMNSNIFEKWFQNILSKLPDNAVVLMDNASYHSRRVERLPTSTWRKAAIEDWLRSKDIPFNTEMLRAELLHLVCLYKEQYNTYVTDEMAAAAHKTVLPPYHCEPIQSK